MTSWFFFQLIFSLFLFFSSSDLRSLLVLFFVVFLVVVIFGFSFLGFFNFISFNLAVGQFLTFNINPDGHFYLFTSWSFLLFLTWSFFDLIVIFDLMDIFFLIFSLFFIFDILVIFYFLLPIFMKINLFHVKSVFLIFLYALIGGLYLELDLFFSFWHFFNFILRNVKKIISAEKKREK